MKTIGIVMLGLAVAASFASADPRTYINATGDQLLDCNPDSTDATGDLGVYPADSQGGVCFAAGHIDGSSGGATITLTDELASAPSGFLCQDLNADDMCGDEAAGEFPVVFCGAAVLTVGGNWNPDLDTLVWIDGPVFGNPALTPCGDLSYSGGHKGQADH